jgi:hypothetical protein
MEWLLAGLIVLGVLFAAVVAVTVHTVRIARRAVGPVVHRAGLVVAAQSAGAGGAVARLRRDLDDAVRRGRKALAVAAALGTPVGDVPGLFDRIETAAADVDGELRAISAVADPRRRGSLLAAATRRVTELVDAADDLASAVASAAAAASGDVGDLRSACLAEAEALREGARVRQSWGRLAG